MAASGSGSASEAARLQVAVEVAVRDFVDRNLHIAAAPSFDVQVAASRGVGDRGAQPYGLHGREGLRAANTMPVLGNPIADSGVSGEEDDEQDESQQDEDEPTPKRVRVMAPRQVLLPKLLLLTTATTTSVLLL